MLTQFWDKLGEELAKQWSVQELGSALVFWLGGLLTWVWHGYYLGSWPTAAGWLAGINNPVAYVALLVGGLLVLAASSTVAAWLQSPVLRLAEGYLPWPLRGLQHWLAGLWAKPIQKWEDRWWALDQIAEPQRTARQQYERALLDARRMRYPADVRNLMPTPLGNLLRAAEEYPQVRYGLTTSVCWPRLWLLLPKEAQVALSEARQQLNGAARLLLWGALFVVWTAWAWWAALVALAIVAVAYGAMVQAAGVYGDLLRAAFDLHRFALYEALRLPVPSGPEGEEAHGQRLSEYLFRGTARQDLRFVVPES